MPRATGSGLMSKKQARAAHLVVPGPGLAGELYELRQDLKNELAVEAAMAIEEFTNPATGTAAQLEAATATTVAPRTVLEAGLLTAGKAVLADCPRNVTFTTAGATAADAPATALVTGFDGEGKPQTETVTLAQTAAIASGVKAWSRITSVAYAAADGTGATISIGIGNLIGLRRTPKARAGAALAIREVVDGAFVATGTLSVANKTYTPATAPDGAHDYAVFYEWDASLSLP